MYKRSIKIETTSIDVNDSLEGETLEQKIERVVNNGEPIKDGAEIIYTDRESGVRPEYNIRTDRFEIAADAMDYGARSNTAKRNKGITDRKEALDSLKSGKKEGE